jgi:hypothetical protein
MRINNRWYGKRFSSSSDAVISCLPPKRRVLLTVTLVYFNSFMASLNLRRCIRRKLSTPAGDLLPPEEGKVIA